MTRYFTAAALIGAAFFFSQKSPAPQPTKPTAPPQPHATVSDQPILKLITPGKPAFVKGTTLQKTTEGWIIEGQDRSHTLQNNPVNSMRAAGGGGHFLAFQTSTVSGPFLLLSHPSAETLAEYDEIKCYAAPCGTVQFAGHTFHVFRFVRF